MRDGGEDSVWESDPGVKGLGIGQGCPFSLLLFKLYAKVVIMLRILGVEWWWEGIILNGQADICFWFSIAN